MTNSEAKFNESDQMFHAAVEHSHSGVFIVDNTFHLVYANGMLGQILGYEPADLIGHDFRDFLDEESKKLVADRYIRRQRGEELPSRYQFCFFRKDGEKRTAELSSSVVRDPSGNVRTVGQILDVTERQRIEEELHQSYEQLENRVAQRTSELLQTNALLLQEINQRSQAEEALRKSETKYRHLVENANSIILEMDPHGNVAFLNKFGLGFFGFKEEEIIGKSVVGTIVPERDTSGKDLEWMIEDITHNPEKYRNNENENMRRNGERVWITWTNQPMYNKEGKLSEILCIGIDRTEQRRAETEIARQTSEKVAAEERNRLARDLHDAVSQTLFSASIIAEVLPKIWERNQEEGRKRLEEIRQLTRGAVAEMRTLLLELRPTALADAELDELLQQLAESVTGRTRVPVQVKISGAGEIPSNVKMAFYRIAQEALNNVAKHAHAKQAKINLNCSENKFTMDISDDGRGFDTAVVPPDSLGMGIMRERAKTVNATFEIDSKVGNGTTITVRWEGVTNEQSD